LGDKGPKAEDSLMEGQALGTPRDGDAVEGKWVRGGFNGLTGRGVGAQEEILHGRRRTKKRGKVGQAEKSLRRYEETRNGARGNNERTGYD